MKLAVIGTGYVGLVAGVCLVKLGHHVTCIDTDPNKISALKAGEIPIYEPGLHELLAESLKASTLTFANTISAQSIGEAEVIFIAVGTPMAKDGNADLGPLYRAIEEIIVLKNEGHVVVKSTVPPGTSRILNELRDKLQPSSTLRFSSNPEFLQEGNAIENFFQPDRIVVGVADRQSEHDLRDVYSSLIYKGTPFIATSPSSSELIKYAANCYLASRLSFFNEISDLCEVAGASYREVAFGVGMDSRIGRHFMKTGPGYGGSCFPKDTQALAFLGRNHGMRLAVTEAAISTNENRKKAIAGRIIAACGGTLTGKRIGVLGLAFKAETDDMREATSLAVIPALLAAGATVFAHDPEAMPNAKKMLTDVQFVDNAMQACHACDAIVILTEWAEYQQLRANSLRAIMKGRIVLDFRNIFDPMEFSKEGFTIVQLGEQVVEPTQ